MSYLLRSTMHVSMLIKCHTSITTFACLPRVPPHQPLLKPRFTTHFFELKHTSIIIMAKRSTMKLKVFLLLLAVVVAVANAVLVAGVSGKGGRRREFPPEEEHGGGGSSGRTEFGRRYILHDSKRVVETEAGGMRVVEGVGGKFTESPMHIGFITMEPNSMFIPQYLDSSLILFVEIGEARIGSIYEDELVEQDLVAGDIYRIQAGSAFYLVNTAQGQRLHIITSIDTAESSDWSPLQSFYIGGGTNPKSVLAGFDRQTLATAFNVSFDMIDELLLSRRQSGAIVYLNPDGEPQKETSMWKMFLEQETHMRKSQMKRIVQVRQKNNNNNEEVEKPSWSLRKLLISLFGKTENKDDKKSLDSYNIYERKADFSNDYGWSIAVDEDDYEPLKKSNFGVYLVNLTAGSMMAPHINPTATEYGIVLSGSGSVQIVYPNGTLAMDAEVKQGDVFWIPRYYPFCQVASRSSPFVFFGFTTCASSNWPQFLVGKGSLLHIMLGPEFAAAFGTSEDKLAEILNAQDASTILPSASASPGGGGEGIPEGEGDHEHGGGGDHRSTGQGGDEEIPEGEGERGDRSRGEGVDESSDEAELLMGSKIRMKIEE